MWGDPAGLPPLIIGGVDDMEDVPILEAEPLAGEAAVLCLLIVKQCPIQWNISGLVFSTEVLHSSTPPRGAFPN